MARNNNRGQTRAANQPTPPAPVGQAGAGTGWDDATANASSSAASGATKPNPPEPPKPQPVDGTVAQAQPQKFNDPHFKGVSLPKPALHSVDKDDDDEPVMPKDEKFNLPNDLAQSQKMMAEARKLPVRNPREQARRNRIIAILGAHINRLENGPAAPHVGATALAKSLPKNHSEIMLDHKLKSLANTYPEVKLLLAQRVESRKSMEAITKKNEELATANAALAKENEELKASWKKPESTIQNNLKSVYE